MHLKKQLLLWTSWTDFGKERLLPVCVLGVRYAGKCRDPGSSGADHQVQGCVVAPGLGVCVISLQLRLLGSTAPTTMWYMASAVGSTVSAQAVGFLSGTFGSSI